MTLSSSASSLLPTRTLQTSGEAFLTEIHKKCDQVFIVMQNIFIVISFVVISFVVINSSYR